MITVATYYAATGIALLMFSGYYHMREAASEKLREYIKRGKLNADR